MKKDIVTDMSGERRKLKDISDILSQSIDENDNENNKKNHIHTTM